VLTRLYNPARGRVFIDGVDLVDVDLDSWRQRLSVAPQRPFLFSDSIASNIGLAQQADQQAVDEAMRAAALDADLQTLPDGRETVVGERGIMLSGGQRQRVALARALHRQGDVVILDDVLSAVDHSTEAKLVESVAALAADADAPTIFVASHRLSALRHCDTVLVLDRGRLIDQGTHTELIERPGLYRDTWRIQSQRAAGVDRAAS
jgi:ABC-type multidrug transport system fused ATPase/permease subunit